MLTFKDKLRLCWRILRQEPGNIERHADRELRLLLPDGDEMNEAMRNDAQEMLLVFSTQGHSGFSAGYITGLIEKLMRFEPLLPLRGTDDEWNEVSEEDYQNNRCSHVFKSKATGEAYDIDGRIFREPSGACFTSYESRVPVTFPYTPKREYVDVEASAA